ncbi:thiamine pyrophosphate-dependent enzyme [Brevibacterium spongiae]|uniref:Thiamine pyrophosphate-dependent enzyme n=1 Tax=Brevibacterium spongiae TaxID=2909672 RepID=A0ABY5SUN4_9MICO|nr:thiamine pyrophosphate-dependent enzyme [Brevibacterium spongiae]UVI36858.1 thiamine pyrophosphate-dependent enzyme [Brevibacterium spongiae]
MDTSASLSAGHLIVEELEAHGVRRAYLVPGESYLDVIDGLHDSSLTPIVCRQEGGAAYMAVAEGRMTGIPGIAMVTRGPGAANVMVGVHTAYQDATPLVVFVGLIPTDHRGRESFQEFDLSAWFSTTAKKVLTLDDPDKAAEVVADAMHTAVAGRPGPVIVGLPEEVLVQASAGTVLPPRVHGSASPYAGDLTELRARITAADRPVLIIGGEDWPAATSRRIAQWSRDRGLGVLGTFRAYDGIDHDSPNFLGILGYGAAPVAKRTLAEADLHIFLGCVRTDVATAGFTLGTDQRTVVIGPDGDAHGHFGRLDQHIVTSVSRFAQTLFTEDGSRTYSVSSDGSIDEPPASDALSEAAGDAVPLPDWVAQARDELETWRQPQVSAAADGAAASAGYVDMDEAFVHVKDLLPENAIVTYGAGNFSGWATRFLPTHGFPSALGPRNGSMGFGLPAAVAAALVHPERPVFCIAGDGDFLMNGQEMATAVQHGADITVVVNDNSVYGTIRGHQDREYPGRAVATALQNPDFAAMATAFGGLGIRVERTQDFRDAFDRALKHKGLSLVHCITDPDVRGARLP